MKIKDNFLKQNVFNELQTLIMGASMVWSCNDDIDYKENDKFQFTHLFYHVPIPRSMYFEKFENMLQIINPISLWWIKANLLTTTPNIVEHEFHVDMEDVSEEKLKQWTTSIFYINTNNGYTKFEDGTKVESVANRFVTFSTNNKHSGSTCTDQKRRIVINFNYFV